MYIYIYIYTDLCAYNMLYIHMCICNTTPRARRFHELIHNAINRCSASMPTPSDTTEGFACNS